MPSLLQRLKERKLFQWGLAYLAGAWLIFQGIEVLAEPWNLSEALQRTIHVLLGVGFFVALILAWYHGEKGRQRASGVELLILAGILVIAGAAVALLGRGRHATQERVAAQAILSPETIDSKSVAVLPLENLSGEEATEPFTNGIHDDILTHLYKIGDLKVISRTSVLEYRDTRKNLRQIADELGVAAILEGGVQRAGNRVRINVQLIDAETDEHLWAETYEEDLTAENVFAIQTDIAQRIASALKAQLTPEESERIAARPTKNLEAYDYYLRGKEYGRRPPTIENRRIAEEMYLKALELDQGFALAYAALAGNYSSDFYQYRDRSQEVADKARDAAYTAAELDPDLAEAHLALGQYFYRVLVDYDRAFQEYTIAVRLNPNNGDALAAIATVQRRWGEWEEALTNFERAFELSPRDQIIVSELANTILWVRRYDEAMPVYDRYITLAPDGGYVWVKAWGYLNEPDGIEEALQVRVAEEEADPSAIRFPARTSWDRTFIRTLHDHYREAVRGPIPESARDTSGYLLAKAVSYDLTGETVQARAYYDSARVGYEAWVEKQPEAPGYRSVLGIGYAGLGRTEDAIREAVLAVELSPVSEDALLGPFVVFALAEVYVMVGEYDAAIDQLAYLLSIPCPISPPLLRADPLWAPSATTRASRRCWQGTSRGNDVAARRYLDLCHYCAVTERELRVRKHKRGQRFGPESLVQCRFISFCTAGYGGRQGLLIRGTMVRGMMLRSRWWGMIPSPILGTL